MRRAAMLAGLALGAIALTAPALAAGPYPPPSTGSAQVQPSRIKLGECATFSGDGFARLASLAISDNGERDGTTRADSRGEFSYRICPSERGRHELAAQGKGSQGDELTVTAILFVEGVRQSSGNSGTTGGGAPPAGPGAQPTASSSPEPGVVVNPPQAGEGPGGGSTGGGAGQGPEDGGSGLRFALVGLGVLVGVFVLALILLSQARGRGTGGGAGPSDPSLAPV